jgi:adenylate cyclase
MDLEAKGIDQPIAVYDVQGIAAPYHLSLPARAYTLLPLREEIPLRYTFLEGTHLNGTVRTGNLVKLSARRGEIRSPHAVTPLSDVKIQLLGPAGEELPGSLYAKILSADAE